MWLDQASLAELYLAAVFALPERWLVRDGDRERERERERRECLLFQIWGQGQQSHMNTCMEKCVRERCEKNQPIGHPWHLISLVYAQLRVDLDNYWYARQCLCVSLSLSSFPSCPLFQTYLIKSLQFLFIWFWICCFTFFFKERGTNVEEQEGKRQIIGDRK